MKNTITVLTKDKRIEHRPQAKPFLKWAGGKSQLIDDLVKRLPEKIREKREIETYIEPFLGGGAFFFFLKRNFDIEKSILLDVNRDLVIAYKVIQERPEQLIEKLKKEQENYLGKNKKQRKKYYYKIRSEYNKQLKSLDFDNFYDEWIDRTAYLIFLNKTCFNGLYRLNRKAEFNVPHGRYANPTILDKENLLEVNKALQNTKVLCADFSKSKKYVNKSTLIYLDPPYRPLNKTSSFTGFTKKGFDDKDQRRLAQFYKDMDKKGVWLMLSNSDPKNEDPKDNFFDKLYKNYNAERVEAKRTINCNAEGRGEINELIITNY